jgi:hypothetical protein
MVLKSGPLLVLASFLFVVSAFGLVCFVRRLLRSNRAQILAEGSLGVETELSVGEPGEVLLLVDAPRLSNDYRHFEFEITARATGRVARLKYNYAQAQGAVEGVTRKRVPISRFTAQQAGAFLIRVAGLTPGQDYTAWRILFSRPYLGRMALEIIGIVLCGIGLLLSLLLGAWQLFPLQHGKP